MYHWKALVACGVIISGCASNPDVSINYYLAKTDVSVRVVRTLACNAQNELFVASAATTTAVHTAETTAPHSIKLAELDSSLANSDFTVELYDDGRIKGVNATTTGQGQAVLTSAINLGSGVGFFDAGVPGPSFPAVCNDISRNAPSNKTLTLTFEGPLTLVAGQNTVLPVTPEDAGRFNPDLEDAIGVVDVQVASVRVLVPPLSHASAGNHVELELRQPALLDLEVTAGRGGRLGKFPIWSGTVTVGQLGTEFTVPIPRAALFGKQSFLLAVSPAGAITKIGYGNDTGVSQALSSGTTLAEALRDTPAEKAAAIKAEADLIAQQQRLVRCEADHINCK